jgi:hypothetical protein
LERKLTAILCADVYGYSRLMGEDEEATLRTLSAHRKIIDSLIESHRGRFVNSAGDSVLAEFTSVVEAVIRRAPSNSREPLCSYGVVGIGIIVAHDPHSDNTRMSEVSGVHHLADSRPCHESLISHKKSHNKRGRALTTSL